MCLGFFLKILFIYFLDRGGVGRKRGRETSMCERNINWLPLAFSPTNWGLGPQPRYVP